MYNNFARASLFLANFFADNVKIPYFAFYGERKQATMKFIKILSLGIQLQQGSPTFDKLTG